MLRTGVKFLATEALSYFKRFLIQFTSKIMRKHAPYILNEIDYLELRELFLSNSLGVLHLGASYGQEAEFYSSKNLEVIWVECIPEMFKALSDNIKNIDNQRAFQALLSEEHGRQRLFMLSSNKLQSSSLYPFDMKYSMDSGLAMKETLLLKTKRLDRMFNRKELKQFNYWVVDVQGAELEVLKGAGNLLNLCNILEVEVSTFPVYQQGTTYEGLELFLREKGFTPVNYPPHPFHGMVIFVRTSQMVSDFDDAL